VAFQTNGSDLVTSTAQNRLSVRRCFERSAIDVFAKQRGFDTKKSCRRQMSITQFIYKIKTNVDTLRC
jgi:hypothetical protein